MLAWAPHQAFLETLPEEERPEPPLLLQWAEQPWRAFHELSGERAYVTSGYSAGLGGVVFEARPLPIPWSAIMAWCDRAGCGELERSGFVVPLVAALDREFLAHARQQAARGGGAPADDKLARWGDADG